MKSNLDVLRAFAVLCVLSNHVMNVFCRISNDHIFARLGHLGVLLFFVHTALVLMKSLERHGTQPGWVKRFYIRRFFRIYPLSIAVIAGMLLLHIPQTPGEPFQSHGSVEITRNILLIQNVIPDRPILGPLWSLPYEVQMYLLLPGIFVVLIFGRRKTWLVALLVLAFAATRLDYKWPKDVALFLYFPCFMGGVVAWYIGRAIRPRFPARYWPIALILFSSGYLTACFLCHSGRLQWFIQWTFCLLFGTAVPWFSDLKANRFTAATKQIAEHSYGVYLLHDPLLWFCFIKAPFGLPLKIASFMVLLPLVCVFFYRVIEKPAKECGENLTRPAPESHFATIRISILGSA